MDIPATASTFRSVLFCRPKVRGEKNDAINSNVSNKKLQENFT